MIITITKNSQNITTHNNELIRYRRDGGLDTMQVNFYSDDENLLDRWDRVQALSRTWRVSSIPILKINYEADGSGDYQWLYTVNLIESIAVLKGHPMPDIAFTQNLAGTKTIVDALEAILEKQSVRAVGESQKYTLDSSLNLTSEDQAKIAPNDIFKGKSLFEILSYYGELLDAKPTLDETDDTINFTYNNTYDEETVLTPDFFELEISKDTDSYATGVTENAENVHLKDSTNYYPGARKRVYFIPINLEENMGFDNSTLELPFKIKRLKSLQCFIYADPVRVVDLYDEETTIFSLTYDKYIFEEKEWKTIANNSAWSGFQWFDWGVLRKNSIYYKYGDNKIYNLSALEYHCTQAGYSLTSLSNLLVRVEYEAMPDLKIDYKSGDLIDGDIEYVERLQQQSSSVDFEAEYLKLKNDLQNRTSLFYNVGWIADSIPDIESLVQVNQVSGTPQCIITSMSVKHVGSKYEVNARLATDYNRKNPLTRPINENRIFEIPTDQIVTRKISLEVEAHFWCFVGSTIPSVLYETSWGKYQNFFMPLAPGQYESTGQNWTYKKGSNFILAKFYSSSYGYIRVLMPYVRFNKMISDDEMDVYFIASMSSNTAVDMQRYIDHTIPVNYTAWNAIVTDEYGEVENVELGFMKVQNDSVSSEVLVETDIIFTDSTPTDYTFKEAYPFVSADYADNDSYETEVVKPFDEIIVNKDAREKLQFQLKINISSDGNTILNFDRVDYFFDLTLSSYGPTIKATIDGVLVTCTYTNINYYNDYVKINFTYPATGGVVSDVRLFIASYEYLRVLTTKTVSGSSSDYLAIYITDKL